MLAGMNDLTTILSEPVARLGATTITLGHALAFGAMLFLGLFVALVVALWRSAKARAVAAAEAADHARDAEARMAGILQSQAEMQGRMGAIAEVFGARQAELDAVDRPAPRRHDRPSRPDHDRADEIDA